MNIQRHFQLTVEYPPSLSLYDRAILARDCVDYCQNNPGGLHITDIAIRESKKSFTVNGTLHNENSADYDYALKILKNTFDRFRKNSMIDDSDIEAELSQ